MAVTELNFDNIIFDLDGTLTDPQEGFVTSIGFALRSLGRQAPPAEELCRFIGPPIHGTFQSLLGTDDSAVVEKAVGLYRRRLGAEGIRENVADTGVAEMLTGLKAAGRALFVATAKPLEFAVPILEHCGLKDFFTGVYGSDLGRTNTPKGELIRAVLDDWHVATDSAAMIGDRSHDIVGAKENGVYSVGVTYGYGSAAELREAGVDLLCNSPEQLGILLFGFTLTRLAKPPSSVSSTTIQRVS
ncbi:MAG: HAD hydrolase-like protein [Janthinobacterium lividum]